MFGGLIMLPFDLVQEKFAYKVGDDSCLQDCY
jgi:hypothetical protein